MDHFNKLKHQVQGFIFFLLLGATSIVILGGWIARQYYPDHDTQISLILLSVSIIIILWLSVVVTNYATKPLDLVWRAVLHISTKGNDNEPPNLYKSKVGQELVTTLARQVYEAARQAPMSEKKAIDDVTKRVSDSLPVPIIAMNQKAEIVYVNNAAIEYLALPAADLLGQHLGNHVTLDFPDDNTFSAWLTQSRRNKVTATTSWQRVRLHTNQEEHQLKQFDMAGYYAKDSAAGIETILTIFDRTASYGQDDEGLGFVALAVHELRTPLTMLRGYIEVFDDELTGQLDPEMQNFMHKMQASSEQLSAFVNNILNVARVEGNQLALRLTEEQWPVVLKQAIQDIKLRVQVHRKVVEWEIAPNLPKVAVDKVTISEVIANLIDNAVKYSDQSKRIVVKSYLTQDGMVETTVQDFGVGIPSNVVPHLFEKFQRNHRNRAQIGGTGLGLYLSKAIISAHGGNIWVKSQEGQGSVFGFTLQPYETLADELKTNNNQGIERTAHGWIKNHSMYRR